METAAAREMERERERGAKERVTEQSARTHLRPASRVSAVRRSRAFSSRLMRTSAAATPMATAKMGSASLEIR